jgi:hypothetical protein
MTKKIKKDAASKKDKTETKKKTEVKVASKKPLELDKEELDEVVGGIIAAWSDGDCTEP